MAKLSVYTDRAVRNAVARQYLTNLGIEFDEVNVETDPNALAFLESQGRDLRHYPLPQFYVGSKLAWDSFKELNGLTAEQINDRVGELNA